MAIVLHKKICLKSRKSIDKKDFYCYNEFEFLYLQVYNLRKKQTQKKGEKKQNNSNNNNCSNTSINSLNASSKFLCEVHK